MKMLAHVGTPVGLTMGSSGTLGVSTNALTNASNGWVNSPLGLVLLLGGKVSGASIANWACASSSASNAGPQSGSLTSSVTIDHVGELPVNAAAYLAVARFLEAIHSERVRCVWSHSTTSQGPNG